MGLARKKRKICPKLGHPESRDRISSLPDEILGQILSFLPTKYAVATSALSSRWRNLYKLTTSLDFDDSASFKSQKGLNIVRRNTRFREFVDSILARFEQSNVTKFRLKCGKNNFDNSLITYWIKVACSHEISEFELSIHTCVPYRLPLQRYPLTCQNLAVLKLDSNFEVAIPDSVAFPCLKVLVLKEIKLSSDSSLNDILPRCPLLEELVIEGCDIAEGNVCITNPLLRRLTLDDGLTGPLDQLNGTVVYFDAPNLIYLKYCKCLVHRCKVRDLNALVEAYIEICFNDDDFDEPEDLCDAMLSFIVGVSNCELLYLSGQCLEALTSGEFELPIFQNLTRLELGVGCDVSWNDVLLDFLSNSPCLEYLIFEEGLIRFGAIDYESEDCQLYDEAVPSCVESRLKVVEIKRFWGLKEEMDTVMYFLENANVLEKLELHWCLKRSARGVLSKEKEILKMYKDLTSKPKYLVTFTVRYDQKANIDACVKKVNGKTWSGQSELFMSALVRRLMGETESGKAPSEGGRERCRRERTMSQDRVATAEQAYYELLGIAVNIPALYPTTPPSPPPPNVSPAFAGSGEIQI